MPEVVSIWQPFPKQCWKAQFTWTPFPLLFSFFTTLIVWEEGTASDCRSRSFFKVRVPILFLQASVGCMVVWLILLGNSILSISPASWILLGEQKVKHSILLNFTSKLLVKQSIKKRIYSWIKQSHCGGNGDVSSISGGEMFCEDDN